MGLRFIVKLICVAIILLIIYTYVFDYWKSGTDNKGGGGSGGYKSIEDKMEDGFVEGALEGADETGILKEREEEAIDDVFDTSSDNEGKTNTSLDNKKKKFYEGDINWKFTDVNSNLDCWQNWDWVSKDSNGLEEVIKADIERTTKRNDGRTWCAVSEATSSDMRKDLDKPPTIMDTVNKYTGNVWGLAGAVGLGLTEELLIRALKKSSQESMEKMAKKVSSESAEKLMKKIGKELQEEGVEKLFKESSEKVGKEGIEKASRETMEKAGKELNERALKEMNKAVSDKFSSKFLRETNEKLGMELKQNVIGKYGKKTINSIKDDIVKKLGGIIKGKTMSVNTKLIGNVIKNKAVSSLRSISITSSAKVISSSLQKKILAKLTMELKQALTISIYKNIVKNVAADISTMFAKKMAKVILARTLVKTQFIVVTKVFFRTQAKAILAITKSISKSSDDLAKMTVKLTSLSKTLGKQAIKNGFKTGLKSAAKLASKMKPGPLAIFDILSFALDAADPMNYNAFMSTKDFNKAVEQSNKDRRQLMLDEIAKDEVFKTSGKSVDDIAYPFVLDPLTDIDGEQMEKEISAKISKLFAMAKIGQVDKSISSYLDKLNKDLASGVLTVEKMEDSAIMETYTNLIDTESIVSIYNIDSCKKVGGVLWDTDKCTFSKDKCDKLYTWPLDVKGTPEREGERYAEFIDGKCVMGNPEIRSMCDTMGAKWDSGNYKCKLDKDYCTLKGGTMDDKGECSIPLTQQVFEFIFGTTVTRISATMVRESVDAVKGVFDFFFVGCGYDGEFKIRDKCMDYNDGRIAIWDCNKSGAQKFMYNSIDNSIRPLSDSKKCLSVDTSGNIIVEDYTGASKQKFLYNEKTKQLIHMENQSKCIDLIGDSDSNGTKFQLLQCKDHRAQKFDLSREVITDTGAHCSITSSRSADCPAGYTNNGLTCGRGDKTAFWDNGRAADCPDGYTNNGATCGRGDKTAFWDSGEAADCPDGYTNNGATCGRGDKTAFWDKGRAADCPSGYTNMGLTCYREPQSKTLDFGLGTYESADCPKDYTNTGTTCYYSGHSFQREYFSKAGKSISYDVEQCEKKFGAGNCEIKGVSGSRLARAKSCEREARVRGLAYPEDYVDDGVSTMGARCYRHVHTMGTIGDVGVCPPKNDNRGKYTDKIGALCYVDCKKEYGSDWYNNLTSCWRDPDTKGVESMTCNSDEFFNEKLGRCYKKCKDVHGSDYIHDGTRCYRPADTKGMDSMSCGTGKWKSGAICYKNCSQVHGSEYTHDGTRCYRPVSTKDMSSMTCGEGEWKSGAICYKNCSQVHGSEYTHDGTRCYRPVSTLTESAMTCKSHEVKKAGVCYPKLMPGFTDLGLTQSRKKKEKTENIANLKNAVNKISSAVKSTY